MGAKELWLVRHGESVANVAAFQANRDGAELIPVDHPDPEVPLSATGRRQAEALGDWLAGHRTPTSPSSVWTSPYLRARQTMEIAMDAAELELPVQIDERLRDRDLGILDLHTARGIESRYPDEAARRRWLGKFYYRPPGGESWTDVALRVRSFLLDADRDAERDSNTGCLLVAAHDAVVMLFLYVCLGLDDRQLIEFARENTVTNASVTTLVRPSSTGHWRLEAFAETGHLESNGVPVTVHPGDKDPRIHEGAP